MSFSCLIMTLNHLHSLPLYSERSRGGRRRRLIGEIPKRGTSLNGVALAERNPKLSEVRRQPERIEGKRRTSVVGNIAGQFFGRIIQSQHRQNSVHRNDRRLGDGISGGDKHIHRRKLLRAGKPRVQAVQVGPVLKRGPFGGDDDQAVDNERGLAEQSEKPWK